MGTTLPLYILRLSILFMKHNVSYRLRLDQCLAANMAAAHCCFLISIASQSQGAAAYFEMSAHKTFHREREISQPWLKGSFRYTVNSQLFGVFPSFRMSVIVLLPGDSRRIVWSNV